MFGKKYIVVDCAVVWQHTHHYGHDTIVCHTTAQSLMTYLYHNDIFLPNILTIVTLARFQYELPDDGHRPKHAGAF